MPFQVVWNLFRLLVWAAVVVVLAPDVLGLVGGGAMARWLEAHAWARWLAVPVLGPLFLISAFELRNVRKRPSAGGGTQVPAGSESPAGAVDAARGIREGAAIVWPVESEVVEAGTWSSKGQRRCVAAATLRGAPDFYFAARSTRLEPSWMRGAAQQAIRLGLSHGRKSATPDQAATFEAMEFLGRDAIDMTGTPHGSRIVLRSNQPERARELFSDSEFVRVLRELDQGGRRWELTLMPGGKRGEPRLTFECPGRADDIELAGRAKALMTAAIVRLAANSGMDAAPPRARPAHGLESRRAG